MEDQVVDILKFLTEQRKQVKKETKFEKQTVPMSEKIKWNSWYGSLGNK